MLKKLITLFALLIPTALSGCAAVSTGPAVVSDYCRIARPITYDTAADSAETQRQIEEHNSRWVCVCENDCPKEN